LRNKSIVHITKRAKIHLQQNRILKNFPASITGKWAENEGNGWKRIIKHRGKQQVKQAVTVNIDVNCM